MHARERAQRMLLVFFNEAIGDGLVQEERKAIRCLVDDIITAATEASNNTALQVITEQLKRIADSLEKANAPEVHQEGSNRPVWQMSQEEIDKRRELERFWAEEDEQDRAAVDEVEMHKCTQPERRGYDSNNYCGCDRCPDKENCNDEIPF